MEGFPVCLLRSLKAPLLSKKIEASNDKLCHKNAWSPIINNLTLPLTSLPGYAVSMQAAAKIGMKCLALGRGHSGLIVTLLLVLIPLNIKQEARMY